MLVLTGFVYPAMMRKRNLLCCKRVLMDILSHIRTLPFNNDLNIQSKWHKRTTMLYILCWYITLDTYCVCGEWIIFPIVIYLTGYFPIVTTRPFPSFRKITVYYRRNRQGVPFGYFLILKQRSSERWACPLFTNNIKRVSRK